MTIYEKLSAIQAEVNVPKGQYNSYGGFNYRSCEDILEVVKPICAKYRTVLILSDELVNVRERYYVRASAHLHDLDDSQFIATYAYAREEETKKGMDGSQVTGASSSYARKYALNGLFNIDDVKDSDFTNTNQKETQRTDKAPAMAEYPARQAASTRAPDGFYQPTCADCSKPISIKVHDLSAKKFGVPLCMDCQKTHGS